MPRRRIQRRRRFRRRNGLYMLPFQLTVIYNANSQRTEFLTSGDFNLSNDRPLAIRSYVITTSCDAPVAMQVGFLNGLEQILGPAKVIGQNVSIFRGRFPYALPRDYTANNIRLMSFIFTSSIDAKVVITVKLNCKPYGVQQSKQQVFRRYHNNDNSIKVDQDDDQYSIISDDAMAQQTN